MLQDVTGRATAWGFSSCCLSILRPAGGVQYRGGSAGGEGVRAWSGGGLACPTATSGGRAFSPAASAVRLLLAACWPASHWHSGGLRRRLMLDSGVLCDRELNECRKQCFASFSEVVHKLKETEVQGKFLLDMPRCGRSQLQKSDRKPSMVFTCTSQKPSPSSSRAYSPRPWLTLSLNVLEFVDGRR
jgi:hypothetical protein